MVIEVRTKNGSHLFFEILLLTEPNKIYLIKYQLFSKLLYIISTKLIYSIWGKLGKYKFSFDVRTKHKIYILFVLNPIKLLKFTFSALKTI